MIFSRGRVVLLLASSALIAAIAFELAWVSATGIAVGSDREMTVNLAGAAALQWGSAYILMTLIALVGCWVLPWWLRIVGAAASGVLTVVLAIQLVGWLIAPDTSSIIASVSGSDVIREELHFAGPVLLVVAMALALLAHIATVRSARTWPALASRYERGGGRPDDPWRALDRGVDPTEQ